MQNRRPEPQGEAKHPHPLDERSQETNLNLPQDAAALLDVWLIRDYEIVAEVSAEVSSTGRLLVCHVCGDIEAVIVGFLVPDDEEVWALCGTCVGKLPLHGAVT